MVNVTQLALELVCVHLVGLETRANSNFARTVNMANVLTGHVVAMLVGREMLVIFVNAPTLAAVKVLVSVVSVLVIQDTWEKTVELSLVQMLALETVNVTLTHTLASASVPLKEKIALKSSAPTIALDMVFATALLENVFVLEAGVVLIVAAIHVLWIASTMECVTNQLVCASVTTGGSGKAVTLAFV